jgi:hypothetical protein
MKIRTRLYVMMGVAVVGFVAMLLATMLTAALLWA